MPLKIESFSFGRIFIGAGEYTSDLIIFPGEVYCPWWRKKGHEVCPEDVGKVINFAPEVVVFGTGTGGLVKVLPSTVEMLEDKGAKVLIAPTDKACSLYNDYCEKRTTVACLHLTC